MTLLPFARRSHPGRETLVGDLWVPADLSLLADPSLVDLDIDAVIKEVRRLLPDVSVQRLRPRHPADIFAIWYFGRKSAGDQIGLSSLMGQAPFFVITPQHGLDLNEAEWVSTREEAIRSVVSNLSSNRV